MVYFIFTFGSNYNRASSAIGVKILNHSFDLTLRCLFSFVFEGGKVDGAVFCSSTYSKILNVTPEILCMV